MTASPARSVRRVLPWALLSLALGAAAVAVAVLRFESLPDPYPTHIGPDGRPDAFGARTHARILVPVLVGQVAALSVLATTLAVPERLPRVVSGLGLLGALIGGGTALLSIFQNLDGQAVPPSWAIWVFGGLVLAVALWLVIESLRAGPEEDPDAP